MRIEPPKQSTKLVESSFFTWMNNFPESSHQCDTKRFLIFTRNVCRYTTKKWKDSSYLEQRILAIKPDFDPDHLSTLLIAFEYMLEFHKTPATSSYEFKKWQQR